ncbi:hypothetical protein PRIPAC_74214 [Pristionchus pacificus]|uniref:Uncharacterized protein n=1 Tax=Pristionchus pacificus TaxID=54126 RepID=A0A2A6CFS8_PRIPA|nr:hypothetical protein PRIPAC_74214 [Pristionchus pacificus]|eukprot:PDM76938.1 hypothetical protein PRIPAC_42333 [Pristionchus pacificus]
MYRSEFWPTVERKRVKLQQQYENTETPSSSPSGPYTYIRFLAEQRDATTTPSTSRVSDRILRSATPPSTSSSPDDDFKRIMRSAQNMIDPSYVEPPLPPPHHPAIKSARERKKTNKFSRHLSIFEDTTKLNYLDGERSRPDSSDDEAVVNLNAEPPSIIDDEDSSVDNLLRDVKHDIHTNPVVHNYGDEHVFRDEDNDFIDNDIDLAVERQLSIESHSSIKISAPRRPEFERNLFEGSLDIPDLPAPPPRAYGKMKK